MKKITLNNYTTDKYYPKIVKAVDVGLQSRNFIMPVEVFISMGLLERRDVENWRAGRIPYLEQAVQCNLSKASRILRILRFHAHDLNLNPSPFTKEKPPAVKCRYDFRNRVRKTSRRLTRDILSGWGNLAFVMRSTRGIRTTPTRKVNREGLAPQSR